MSLPFTAADFFTVFARYNEGVWPVQLIFLLAAGASVLAAFGPSRRWSRWTLLLLAVLWLWMGLVYHALYFRPINPAAVLFAVLFVAEAALLLRVATTRGAEFQFRVDVPGIAGSVIIGYALLVYPAVAHLLGHRYPLTPTFGLPCPTTLFTLGMLLWMRPLQRVLFIVPMIWAAIGFSAALQLGVYEDIGLPVAAAVAIVIVLRNRHEIQCAATASDTECDARARPAWALSRLSRFLRAQ